MMYSNTWIRQLVVLQHGVAVRHGLPDGSLAQRLIARKLQWGFDNGGGNESPECRASDRYL